MKSLLISLFCLISVVAEAQTYSPPPSQENMIFDRSTGVMCKMEMGDLVPQCAVCSNGNCSLTMMWWDKTLNYSFVNGKFTSFTMTKSTGEVLQVKARFDIGANAYFFSIEGITFMGLDYTGVGGIYDTDLWKICWSCIQFHFCGDGVYQSWEECDPTVSSTIPSGFSCSDECRLIPHCGDGTFNAAVEACDSSDPLYVPPSGYTCDATCTLVPTGTGCLGGTSIESATCCPADPVGRCCLNPWACLPRLPYCGDGEPNPEQGEECDLGPLNGMPGSGCDATCHHVPICGDGTVNPPVEECDLGGMNGTPGSSCDETCHEVHFCGDEVVDPGEECDNGAMNGSPGNSCDSMCHIITNCGNGTLDDNEQCDDGNNISGDGCGGVDTCPCRTEVDAPPVLCALYPPVENQAGCDNAWVRTYGRIWGGLESGRGVAATSSGSNVYTVGVATGVWGAPSFREPILQKFSSDGDLVPGWSESPFPFSFSSEGFDVKTGSDDNIYALIDNWSPGMLLMRYTPAQVEVWSRSISGAPFQPIQGAALALDSAFVYVAGSGYSADIEDQKIWVAKLRLEDGIIVTGWPRMYDNPFGPNWGRATAIKTDADGNILVAGEMLEHIGTYSYTHPWLGKLSPAGDLLWSRVFESQFDCGCGLEIDASGSIFMAMNAPFDLASPSVVAAKINPADGSTVAEIAVSDPAWRMGGADVEVDLCGNLYVTGYSKSETPTDVQPWLGVFDPAGAMLFSYPMSTIAPFTVDVTDSFAGAEYRRRAMAIDLDTNGSIYMTGHFQVEDWITDPLAANHDVWTMKLTPGSDPFGLGGTTITP